MWKRPEEVQLNKYVSSREFFNEVFNLDYMFLIEGVSPYFSATLNGSQIKMNPQEVGYQSYLSEIVFDANTIQKSGELIATFYSPDHRIYGTIFKSRVNSFGCEAFPTSGLKSVIAYINYDNRIYEGCITIINAESDIIESMIIDD